MNIAMLASIEETVPPTKYGGTELVIGNLIDGLMSRGHTVTLFGSGDSAVNCRIIPLVDRAIRSVAPFDHDLTLRSTAKYHAIGTLLIHLQSERFDILHNHIGPRLLLFSGLIHQPMVTTLHMPNDIPERSYGLNSVPGAPLVSISNNQRKTMPELNYVATVYNGIDVSLFPFSNTSEGYLMFLGRFTKDKGVAEAIDVARKTGKKLVIAAKIDEVDKPYFEQLKPVIDGEQIRLVGEMDFHQKAKLLSGADALLAPIQWEEPFGLYVIEAMACGTPVLGISRGSLPEIIEHGKNGFLSHSVDEMVSQVTQIPMIDRMICRKSVEVKFSKTTMTTGYEAVYQKVIG